MRPSSTRRTANPRGQADGSPRRPCHPRVVRRRDPAAQGTPRAGCVQRPEPAGQKAAGMLVRLSRIRYGVTASRNSQHPGEGPGGAGTSALVAAKAAAINAAQAHPLTWKTVVKRALVVAVAGAAIYLALPSLIAVLG